MLYACTAFQSIPWSPYKLPENEIGRVLTSFIVENMPKGAGGWRGLVEQRVVDSPQ